jgi:hypothetical protein
LFEESFQIAPEPACQRPPRRSRAKSSYSVHELLSTRIACRSPPPSIFTFEGIGYGPRSLSEA